MHISRLLLLTCALLLSTTATARADTVSPQWYIVLFVVDGCHFCEAMRKRVFTPMLSSGELHESQFYEINMTDKGEWFYFDPMNTYLQKQSLYKKYALGLFPTTVILDRQANMLVKLVGITTPEKFSAQLDHAISQLPAPSTTQ